MLARILSVGTHCAPRESNGFCQPACDVVLYTANTLGRKKASYAVCAARIFARRVLISRCPN